MVDGTAPKDDGFEIPKSFPLDDVVEALRGQLDAANHQVAMMTARIKQLTNMLVSMGGKE